MARSTSSRLNPLNHFAIKNGDFSINSACYFLLPAVAVFSRMGFTNIPRSPCCPLDLIMHNSSLTSPMPVICCPTIPLIVLNLLS